MPSVIRTMAEAAVVTDLRVLEFSKERGRPEVGSLHPGLSLDDVQTKTGFPLHEQFPAPTTPPPAASELDLLRGRVRQELEQFYPEFVRAQS